MAETLIRGCDGRLKWQWYDISYDLEIQGGLKGVVIDPLTMLPNFCSGQTESGTHFTMSWVPKMFLLVSVSKDEPALIEAFSKVVESRPFCKYSQNGLLTFEWDQMDPVGRLHDLKGQMDIMDLQEIK